MGRHLFGVVGIFFAVCGVCAFGQMGTTKTIALRCGSLFDSRGDSVRKNVVIVVEGEKIKEIANSAPGGVEVVDLSRETCLPGLIDTHGHFADVVTCCINRCAAITGSLRRVTTQFQ